MCHQLRYVIEAAHGADGQLAAELARRHGFDLDVSHLALSGHLRELPGATRTLD